MDKLKLISFEDLIKRGDEQEKELTTPSTTKAWIDVKCLTIEVPRLGQIDNCYQIDLERCLTPESVIDWIFQIGNKTWMTGELMLSIIQCLEYSFIVTSIDISKFRNPRWKDR